MQTFVVRLWTPAGAEMHPEPPILRGIVEQVGFAGPLPFHGPDELLDLFERSLARADDPHVTTTTLIREEP
jgi:hypothetical protein